MSLVWRALVASLSCLVAVMPSPLSAGPLEPGTRSGRALELTSITTLVGEQARQIRVHIPEPTVLVDPNFARFDREITPGFTVRGEGDFVGFALVEESEDTPRFAVIGGRLPLGARSSVLALPIGASEDDFSRFVQKGEIPLPAGQYRLYLLPGGEGAAAVTLRLPGLPAGRQRIRPREPADYDLQLPPSALPDPDTQNIYSAGGSSTMKSKGLLFSAMWLQVDAHVAGSYGYCAYDGAPPPEPAAYLPGCPLANVIVPLNDALVIPMGHLKIFIFGALPFGPGEVGQGVWYSNAAAVRESGSLNLWLSDR